MRKVKVNMFTARKFCLLKIKQPNNKANAVYNKY